MNRVSLRALQAALVTGVPAAVVVVVSLSAHVASSEAAPPGVAEVRGSFSFGATADRDLVMPGDRTVRVRVDIASLHTPTKTDRVPTDLVVVLDESGSMSGDKTAEAKHAAAELVGLLGAEDRFALVGFSSGPRQVISMDYATPANKSRWLGGIRGLQASGGTDMIGGLSRGKDAHALQSGRARRTVLISDGIPNQEHGLRELALASARDEVPLTTVGIGQDYNDRLMRDLADAGTGAFYYAADTELARVFRDELQTGAETVASAVVLKPELARGVTLRDAAGLVVDGDSVRVGSLYASQQRSFWLTLDVTTDAENIDLGALTLEVVDTTGVRRELHADLPSVNVTQSEEAFVAGLDQEAWGQAVVQEEWNRVRQQVAEHVQAGNGAAAKQEIAAYRQRVGTLNASVGSAAVTDNLVEAEELAEEVEQTLQQDQQQQRAWSLGTSSSGWSGRRTGSAR